MRPSIQQKSYYVSSKQPARFLSLLVLASLILSLCVALNPIIIGEAHAATTNSKPSTTNGNAAAKVTPKLISANSFFCLRLGP